MRVFRIQDADGRGPFKPGFSSSWTDEEFAPSMLSLPPWGTEFGWDLIEKKGWPGEHFGTAVRSLSALNRWFSPTEQRKLSILGYRAVELRADRILAESDCQLVFARRKPLRLGAKPQPWPWTLALEAAE